MLYSAIFAFLHHVAAFIFFGALVAEAFLMNVELNEKNVRRLALADGLYGASAAFVFVFGIVRVLYFEKGEDYYFGSAFFLAKFGLFLLTGILSIVPTMQFLSWRRALKAGPLPEVSNRKLRTIKMIIHTELLAVMLILLFAALMARGLEL